MTTAMKGPLVVYGQRPPLGSGGSENPYLGPSMFYGGVMLLDSRAGYNNTVAGAQGWLGDPGDMLVADYTPSTLSAVNIAASQSPGAGTITLVSSSGAGITVLSAAQFMPPAGTTIPINTLLIDGNPGTIVGFGRQAQSNSSQYEIKAYNPANMIGRNIRIVSGGNDTGITFTVSGYDAYGFAMTETVTGANASTASGKKAFKFVTGVTHTGSVATTVTIGTGDVYGFPLQVLKFMYVEIFWNSALITATTGFLAADTTSPATATTGDARGTYAVQSASDGTKQLQVWCTIPVTSVGTVNGAASLYGVSQA